MATSMGGASAAIRRGGGGERAPGVGRRPARRCPRADRWRAATSGVEERVVGERVGGPRRSGTGCRRVAERHRLGQARELLEHVDVATRRRASSGASRNAAGATGSDWTGSRRGTGRRRRCRLPRSAPAPVADRGERHAAGVGAGARGPAARARSCRRRTRIIVAQALGLVGGDVAAPPGASGRSSAGVPPSAAAIASSSRSFTGMRLPGGERLQLLQRVEVRGDAGVFLAACAAG